MSRATQPFVIQRRMPQSEEKWQSLEERLRVVDLWLVPNVGLLVDFKTPECDKYKGSSCPKVHLAMYCQKMAAYIYDDKVLIHYFQDSLTGATLNWHVKTWRELAEAFLKQYKYNENMAPDHSWL
ncbi:hypothetical protein CR513_33669, partial [Mucuna pruriens]